jgi:hypothetical protein
VAVVCALVLVGCAERQSRTQYEQTVKHARTARIGVLEEMGRRKPDDEAFFKQSQERMRTAAQDLAAVSPPSDVQSAHDTHVDGLKGLAKILGEFAICARIQMKDAGEGSACRKRIDSLEIDEVRNDLEEADTIYRQKGYDIGKDGDQ